MTLVNTLKPDIVLYHKDCFDGTAAAWSVWKRFGDYCQYIAVDYDDPPPDVTDKIVVMVDFSYKKPVIETLGKQAKLIVILDHHVSAERELADYMDLEDPGRNVVFIFNKDKSGARLAWDFFHPKVSPSYMIRLIEDRDLWKFQYPDTRAFGIYLGTQDFSISTYDKLNDLLNDPVNRYEILLQAHAMLRLFDSKVEDFASHAHWHTLLGHDIISVNCPLEFRSDVGNYLLDKYPQTPFSATFFVYKDKVKWSLRSRDDREDVSKVAEVFGGGGHHNAASFSVPTMIL